MAVEDPFAAVDLSAGLEALLQARAAGGLDAACATVRLSLAAFAGHEPAAQALTAAGLEVPFAPRNPDAWCTRLREFGSAALLRAAYGATCHAFPCWEALEGEETRPRDALAAVARWFAALRRSTKKRTRTGLDAFLADVDGALEVECLRAGNACQDAVDDARERWKGLALEELWAAAHAAEAAGRTARAGAGSVAPSVYAEAIASAAGAFYPSDGPPRAPTRAEDIKARLREAKEAVLPAAREALVKLALAPLPGRGEPSGT